MPVIGHAFVGLGTAMCGRSFSYASPRSRTGLGRAWLWTPMVVGLAYLPDIVAQLAGLCGMWNARVVTHSVLFALVASPVAGLCVSRLCGARLGGAILVSLVSIVIHDGLDLLQSTDRRLWWPVSDRPIGFDPPVLPVRALTELALFGGGFVVFAVCWVVMRRHRAARSAETLDRRVATDALWGGYAGKRGRVWLGRMLSVGIVVAAGLTHHARAFRESRLEDVRMFLARREYTDALTAIGDARRWPSTAAPGWLDYAAAECFAGMGDRLRAEQSYLRSLAADPSYFWAVADLAVLYATADEPVDARRRRVTPWLRRLRTDFANHRDLDRMSAKIERALAAPR